MIPESNATGPQVPENTYLPSLDAERQRIEDPSWAATAPEVQQHRDKLVVVHKKRVVAVGTDHDVLLEQASRAEKCPGRELVVMLVTADFSPDLNTTFTES